MGTCIDQAVLTDRIEEEQRQRAQLRAFADEWPHPSPGADG
ncbi:hypothetical protein ACFVZE_34815 [Streptomyces anulatus]|nr:hypothetical protein OG865_40250 [Streptomyces anulatus]